MRRLSLRTCAFTLAPALLLCAVLAGCQPREDQGLKNDPLFSSGKSPTGEVMLAAPIPVVGIHHYGRGHHIGEFSVNGQSCGNAGTPRRNSGSDTMCHVPLPAAWHPGIHMHIKWYVTHWNDDLTALQPGNAGSWHEADAEVEPYLPSTGAVGVHFWADHTIRLVPNGYGPPDEDTGPDQTPPLTELPVYAPGWYAMGQRMAAFKHEGTDRDDLKRNEREKARFYDFLQRLYTSRGLSAEQIEALLDKERVEEAREVQSGYRRYLLDLMEARGVSKQEIKATGARLLDAPLPQLDNEIERYLPAKKR